MDAATPKIHTRPAQDVVRVYAREVNEIKEVLESSPTELMTNEDIGKLIDTQCIFHDTQYTQFDTIPLRSLTSRYRKTDLTRVT